VGKTHLAKEAKARGRKPLVIATEIGSTKGLLTLSRSDVPFLRISQGTQQMKMLLGHLKAKMEIDGYEPDLLFWDSITASGDEWEEEAITAYGRKDAYGFAEVGVVEKGEGFDPRKVYQFLAERGRILIQAFLDLPVDLCLIAREGLLSISKDSSVFEQIPAPDLPGARLPREVPGWPEATVRMRMVNGKRRFVTVVEDQAVARVRIDGVKVPKYIEPDVDALCRLLKGDVSMMSRLTPATPTTGDTK
jgi:hypothetical protein